MRLLLIGRTGQLGTAIMREFGGDYEVIAPSHDDLNMTRPSDVKARVNACRPDIIINCAGYNDVDGAEDHALEALDANAFAVKTLVAAALEVDATLVHYSSDFVFSGDSDRPYTEEDEPQPRSFYAASKLLGEWFARDAPKHYVLRVESLFGGAVLGSTRKSSVDRITDAIREGRETVVFSDRTVSPSFVVDVVAATRALVEARSPYGLYHCVNSGSCTWLELANEVASVLGAQARLVPKVMAEVPLRAARPRYCALANAKLARAAFRMPEWRDALVRYAGLLQA